MSFKSLSLSAALIFAIAAPAFAESKIMIHDAYARVASKAAKTGAAFLEVHNMGDEEDRLIDVRSDAAAKVELHTHKDMGDGIMKMMHVEEGFAIPAGETHALARGGDHVMLMGLTSRLAHGDEVNVTLVFEKAGEIAVTIPVDLERKADHGAMDHSNMDHSEMDESAEGKHAHH
ncbi:copper chaperone PCu(A)C [Cognatishimia sp. 1_MG-2023]|uniref:copper chaperone PCu(A)C n=1 Tax=Cognatishimia sp. 1_MG-2023 TaxID=3062642 RepID=UPI0026E339D2|nr:copper chaperone PCu(A)C [Cognatishimia sp. 1_MG-2023]MDO6726073.1 copper chaperone PCu(A)C [Cognatishimia sp. 1_MG-2023]